ncbi:jg6664 [Pararge aegeria aegeria]|uniref:Jg6664 protein n=1 Tax=Pararge aegeria aegeria TaxID=348720 RepID=A0A8S4SN62_9NEOP|nr:jg6664 [Pararge aegeria aegeria]
MQIFLVLLLLGSRLMLTRSRPGCLVQGNDSDSAEAEYEGNDDTAAEDYLREDQESTMDEHKSGRHEEVLREPHEQADSTDSEVAPDRQDKYKYEIFSANDSGCRKERQRHGTTDFKNENEKDYSSEKQHPRNSPQIEEAGNKVRSEIYSRSDINQMKRPQSDSSLNGRSANTNPEYGEMLFEMKPAQTDRQNNLAEEAGAQSRMLKRYMHLKNREQESVNPLNYDRDRRHAQNVEEKLITDSTRTPNEKEEINITNESSENAIFKNIKKLSEQDLEELLNSLPDDKKALLKKIMDKREITKKAGAVDESNYLEGSQADTSKLEGGYSVYCNTESSVTSDTPETSKQPENSESLSSKTPDNESGSKGSGSKSEIINNSNMKIDEPVILKENSNTGLKNDANIYSDAEEIFKNENKRETNNKDLTNDKAYIDDSKIQDYQIEGKDSHEFLLNQEDLSSENEDWLNEPQESNTHVETVKRAISGKDSSAIQDSIKSLKDSFPASNTYEDNNVELEMVPLKRVKRTEKEHQIKKRDLSVLSHANVHFSPEIQSENSENDEKTEFEDYGGLDRESNLVRNDQEVNSYKDVLGNGETQYRSSQFGNRNSVLYPAILSETQKKNKVSLGSDTDSILSGIEGVDDNLMYNSGLRGKRTLESSYSNAEKINLNRSGRTAGPMNVDVVSDNSINVSKYQDDGFGPVAVNSEEDVNRFKRIRQTKQDSLK